MHPVISNGRLLDRLELEAVRMTKFTALEGQDQRGAPSVTVRADLTLRMAPSADGQLAAEILGLAIASDPRIEVTAQPEATPGPVAGQWELRGLALAIAPHPAPEPARDVKGAGPEVGPEDVEGKRQAAFPTFVRMCAQDKQVRLGPLTVREPEFFPATETRRPHKLWKVNINGDAKNKVSLPKLANFATTVSSRSKFISMVGLEVALDQDEKLKARAIFESEH